MKEIKRYLNTNIIEDLKEKMVFVGGPRQVGKTTLSKQIANNFYKDYQYLNWDNSSDRLNITKQNWKYTAKLIILDELHKFSDWKNFIKGEFDKLKNRFHFIVTGSARLGIYRKGGDSLQGRYHYYTLFPFSLSELLNLNKRITPFAELKPQNKQDSYKIFLDLDKFGGFPEPFLKKSERGLRRWHNERLSRLIKEDIRDINVISDLSKLQILASILPSKTASLFSINSITEDLKVSYKTVAKWVDILENFYHIFRIYPYHINLTRSLKKTPKLYLWDWSEISNSSIRFENLIALHLLKFTQYIYEYEGHKIELNYLRNKEGKELDFLISIDKKPWFSVEVKETAPKSIPKQIHYFKKQLQIPYNYIVVKEPNINVIKNDIIILSANLFLSSLI